MKRATAAALPALPDVGPEDLIDLKLVDRVKNDNLKRSQVS